MIIKKIDITDSVLALDVLKVQIPSYMEEAKMINFFEIPPLKDTVDTLRQCEETFFGYYVDGELCGAISLKAERAVMDIHRLIVHPNHFRKGIAKKLLNFIENNIAGIDSIIVSTGSKNEPAINFYEKNGFCKTEESKINERLSITSFRKVIEF